MSWTEEVSEAFRLNRESWDERVAAHWESQMYRRHADTLRSGGHCIGQELVDLVGGVQGRALVHLQCHMGMETLSWSRLGADAVGLDFSGPAIEKAELLRDELGLDTRFVQANVYDAVEKLGRGKFDVVFVSIGALCWLPDVKRWSQVVSGLLKPGGRLVLNESHPVGDMLDQPEGKSHLEPMNPYFHKDGLVYDCDSTYADTDQKFNATRSVEWIHPLGEVVTNLIEAGMTIDYLAETADCVWPAYPMMEQTSEDTWEFPGPMRGKVPMMYTLVGHRD